ncbi:MAG: type ISP restriction/modification enzyme [Desulfococcaceae bacterium]
MKEHYIEYFQQMKQIGQEGTEHTYRTHFENLLNHIKTDQEIRIIHEPKRKKGFGAPDFRIEKSGAVTGYIECKKPGENPDSVIKSEQMKKYLALSDNLILTDYRRFLLFRNGDPVPAETCDLFDAADWEKTKSVLSEDRIHAADRLFFNFFLSAPALISDSQKLAVCLAERGKILKEYVNELLENKADDDFSQKIRGLCATFQEMLVKDMNHEEFADAYAQTVIYGFFLARLQSGETITLSDSGRFVPVSFRVIKEFFSFISYDYSLPNHVSWIFSEIVSLINHIDLKGISQSLSFEKTDTEQTVDPYLYFYETFLGEFDPQKRKAKGVYYTPAQVVGFIIRSIDRILADTFSKSAGFADSSVTVLDFATGTGTFLLAVFELVLYRIRQKDAGSLKSVIGDHLLKNFYGFECLAAPYAVAHLKLSQLLKDSGYQIQDNERLQIYLTDTLDDSQHKTNTLFPVISREGNEANAVKLEKPVLVITGNPPYYSKSKSGSQWVDDYKPSGEKNIQPLHDDYVKFIRFAHHKMEKNRQGVIGIITNNSFLSGLIHRKMRGLLMRDFDEIYILNLHGNARIQETCEDGSADENVFDIMQGVGISLFVKKEKREKACRVFYYDLYGKREDKFGFLQKHDIRTVKWKELKTENFEKQFKKTLWGKERFKEPLNFFVPLKNGKTVKNYGSFMGIYEIFAEYSGGVKTHRDHFIVGFEREELISRFSKFIKNDLHFSQEILNLKGTRDWNPEKAKENLANINIADYIHEYTYRPFDRRNIIYHFDLIERGTNRYNIMQHFIKGKNWGLVFPRICKNSIFDYGYVTDALADVALGGKNTGSETYIAPLYLYQTPNPDLKNGQNGMFDEESGLKKKVNFTKEFQDFIRKKYQPHSPSPEDIFGYIYAVMHCPSYREMYLEFLKMDFPRIPFADDFNIFRAFSEIGSELSEHHLMKKSYSESPVSFPESGSDAVENVRFVQDENSKTGNVFISKTQYFSGIPVSAWEFCIGGYQVLDKWLKSRKGRVLTYQEKEHFKNTVSILNVTGEYMEKIDRIWQNNL